MATPPDPYTSTRKVWTDAMLDKPISDSTHPDLRSYIETNKTLLRLLAFHSAMRPNLQQTYMTPANIKSKVYFMWDFVGRALQRPAITDDIKAAAQALLDVVNRDEVD
ncbi:hypothetical protein LTR17_023301 [Elasticomyces elasticus]|nr:hypothetical protein LTR17_023301 [Elasticomyces elasticus]